MPAIGNAIPIPFRGGGPFPIFDMPLSSSLTNGVGEFLEVSRADADATVTDFEGRVVDVTAEEARFYGARRVQVFAADSTSCFDNPSQWAIQSGITVTRDLTVAPPSVFPADRPVYLCTPTVTGSQIYNQSTTSVPGTSREVVASWWIKGSVAGQTAALLIFDGSVKTLPITLTTEWQRYEFRTTLQTSATAFYYYLRPDTATGTNHAWLTHAQGEFVDGQSNDVSSEEVTKSEPNPAAADINQSFLTDWTADTVPGVQWVAISDDQLAGANAANNFSANWEAGVIKQGEWYAVTFRVNVTSGSFQIHLGGTVLDSVTTAGEYDVYMAGQADSDGAQIFFNGITAFNGVISDFKIRELQDYGSSGNGVKYSNKFNINYAESGIVKTATLGELSPNPEFDIDDTSNGGRGNGDWQWTGSSSCQITGGTLQHLATPSALATMNNTNLPSGAAYKDLVFKAEYEITGVAATSVEIGDSAVDIYGDTIPATVGSHTVYVRGDGVFITNLIRVELPATPGSAFELPYFRIEVAEDIPVANLQGFLNEEASTNELLDSSVPSAWLGVANATIGAESAWRGAQGDGLFEVIGTVGVSSKLAADTRSDPVSASTSYTGSFYVAAGSDSIVYMRWSEWHAGYTNPTTTNQWFDLANQVVLSQKHNGWLHVNKRAYRICFSHRRSKDIPHNQYVYRRR